MDEYTQGYIDALKWAENIAGQDNAHLAIRTKLSQLEGIKL